MPISRIDYSIGENERKMSKDMYDTMLEILHAAKAEIVPFETGNLELKRQRHPRTRYLPDGRRSQRSALNGFCQMHDVKNVFVVDGSAFTTASEKNPTLTILALAWRATDYLAGEMKSGRL